MDKFISKTGKILIIMLTVAASIVICCGCVKDTDCTYLYKTRTGETVEVGLDVSGTGYKLDAITDEFFIMHHDTEIIRGFVRSAESIDTFRLSIRNDAGSEMLKDNRKELRWISYDPDINAMEYSALIRISDKTCVLMSGVISDKASEKDIENVIKKVSVRTIP